jgi:rsbT co-antagonist protein RsbR
LTQENSADISDLVWKVEDILQAASTGDYSQRCPVSISESFADNPLTTIVSSINLLLDDLVAKQRKQTQAEAKLKETIRELEQKIETIGKQAVAIRELSTPAIEVWDGVLVMPIIGVVDTLRSKAIMDEMLNAIANKQSQYVIMDVTGVDIVDTAVANHLIKTMHAGRILGAECILTGLGAAIAQTLVSLGIDFGGVMTLGSLKEGLKYCLSRPKVPTL